MSNFKLSISLPLLNILAIVLGFIVLLFLSKYAFFALHLDIKWLPRFYLWLLNLLCGLCIALPLISRFCYQKLVVILICLAFIFAFYIDTGYPLICHVFLERCDNTSVRMLHVQAVNILMAYSMICLLLCVYNQLYSNKNTIIFILCLIILTVLLGMYYFNTLRYGYIVNFISLLIAAIIAMPGWYLYKKIAQESNRQYIVNVVIPWFMYMILDSIFDLSNYHSIVNTMIEPIIVGFITATFPYILLLIMKYKKWQSITYSKIISILFLLMVIIHQFLPTFPE